MEAASTLAISVGAQALKALDQWLEDTQTARSWYGDEEYRIFTKPSLRLYPFGVGRKINKVFKIRKDDWHLVIENCLSACHTWHRQREDGHGDCSWLALYRSLPETHRGKFLSLPRLSLGSIGVVSSLPAARIDSWGLIVLAVANGAVIDLRRSQRGSFFARFDANAFILTLWQDDITGPTVGHIEPKERISYNRVFTSPEWNHLLWDGISFDRKNHVFGWPLGGSGGDLPAEVSKCPEAPEELVNPTVDAELRQLVIDHNYVQKLRGCLRTVLHECYARCADLERKRHKSIGITSGELRLMQKILLKTKLILADNESNATSYLEEAREDDTLNYAVDQLKVAGEWISRSHDQQHTSERIDTKEPYTVHWHESDTGRLSKIFNLFQNNTNNNGHDGHEPQSVWDLKRDIFLFQRKIVALTRLLTLPIKVDPILSTLGAGQDVSIA